MGDYRLYFLDPSEHITSLLEIEADDDKSAIVTAEQGANGESFELWQRDRLVLRRWLASVD
jgi:hypothetical protein